MFLLRSPVKDSIVPPPADSQVGALTPEVTVFGDVIKVKGGHRGEALVP